MIISLNSSEFTILINHVADMKVHSYDPYTVPSPMFACHPTNEGFSLSTFKKESHESQTNLKQHNILNIHLLYISTCENMHDIPKTNRLT